VGDPGGSHYFVKQTRSRRRATSVEMRTATVLNMGDSIFSLVSLFQGGSTSTCSDSSDANNDGIYDLSDPVFALIYLFSGGAAPDAPFPDCGESNDGTSLGCESGGACES